METPRPYRQRTLRDGTILREFRSDAHPDELVWHQDRERRSVRVVESGGWMLQLEEGLPFPLVVGNTYEIPSRSWHRVIRGPGNLKIEIVEGDNVRITESQLRKIVREEILREKRPRPPQRVEENKLEGRQYTLFEEKQEEDYEDSETDSPVDAARAIVSANPFISKYADAVTEDSLVPVGSDYLFFVYPGLFDHTLRTHAAKSSNPGSKFSSEFSSESGLLDLIEKAVSSRPPKIASGRYKWMGVELGSSIGTDAIRKALEGEGKEVEDYEEIKNVKALPAILKGGLRVVGSDKKTEITPEEAAKISAAAPEEGKKYYVKQSLKTVEGEQPETNLVNIVMSPIGKTPEESTVEWKDGKERTLLSLVTMFPGVSTDDSGKELTSKEAFVKAGYVFIRPKSGPKSESSVRGGEILVERWQKIAGLIKNTSG